jgi:hypothetical protein
MTSGNFWHTNYIHNMTNNHTTYSTYITNSMVSAVSMSIRTQLSFLWIPMTSQLHGCIEQSPSTLKAPCQQLWKIRSCERKLLGRLLYYCRLLFSLAVKSFPLHSFSLIPYVWLHVWSYWFCVVISSLM